MFWRKGPFSLVMSEQVTAMIRQKACGRAGGRGKICLLTTKEKKTYGFGRSLVVCVYMLARKTINIAAYFCS